MTRYQATQLHAIDIIRSYDTDSAAYRPASLRYTIGPVDAEVPVDIAAAAQAGL